ncbi:MAG: hypothetical protein I4N50_32610 [Rhizobium sp.]|nr:hypothetical protein [Rhizobium sp.]
MILPARPAELRTITLLAIIARTREPRPLIATAIVARPVELARAVAEWTRTALGAIGAALPLLPRLGFAARRTVAEILARATITIAPAITIAAARKLPLAAEFPLGPIAVARWAIAIGSLAARRVWPLLAVAVA